MNDNKSPNNNPDNNPDNEEEETLKKPDLTRRGTPRVSKEEISENSESNRNKGKRAEAEVRKAVTEAGLDWLHPQAQVATPDGDVGDLIIQCPNKMEVLAEIKNTPADRYLATLEKQDKKAIAYGESFDKDARGAFILKLKAYEKDKNGNNIGYGTTSIYMPMDAMGASFIGTGHLETTLDIIDGMRKVASGETSEITLIAPSGKKIVIKKDRFVAPFYTHEKDKRVLRKRKDDEIVLFVKTKTRKGEEWNVIFTSLEEWLELVTGQGIRRKAPRRLSLEW